MRDAGNSAYQASQAAAEKGYNMAGNMQENLSDTFRRQPLLLGAIGIAIGAGIAAALPTTQAEKDAMGKAASDLKDQLGGAAREQVEKLSSVATRAFNEVKAEAEQQGLTPDAAKDSLRGVGEKFKSAAESTRDALKDRPR
jgi:hypothetical protein